MQTDICSVWAYEEIKESGYIGKAQAMYMSVFCGSTRLPLTHLQATKLVEKRFFVKMPERNGRVAELEEKGFLEKFDHVVCEFTGKTVNRWQWTGRTNPLPQRVEKFDVSIVTVLV